MAREGRTLTKAMSIEARQHELFGIDLGEGPVRSALVFGFAVTLMWWLVLFATIGPPSVSGESRLGGLWVLAWFLPPIGLVAFGWQEDKDNPRRRNITKWALAVRQVARGHRPITALGRTERKADRLPLVERVGIRFGGGDPTTLILPGQYRNAAERAARRVPRRHKQHVDFAVTVQHIGTDHAERVMNSAGRRATRLRRAK